MMSEYLPLDRFKAVYVVDLCHSLCEQAKLKVAAKGWTNVHVVEGDACAFTPPEGEATLVTFSYSLSSEWARGAGQRAFVPGHWGAAVQKGGRRPGLRAEGARSVPPAPQTVPPCPQHPPNQHPSTPPPPHPTPPPPVIPPFIDAIDNAVSWLAPDGLLAVSDFFVSARYDVPMRQMTWARRFFWRSVFDIDNIDIGPERRQYLETKLEVGRGGGGGGD